MSETDVQVAGPDALDLLVASVDLITDDAWERPSNLRGWTIRDLVAHVTGSVHKISAFIENEPIVAKPSEPSAWHSPQAAEELRVQSERARALLPHAPLEELRATPMGEAPLRIALRFPLVDAVVHSWDIHRSLGRPLELPPGLLGLVGGLTARMGSTAEEPVPGFDAPLPAVATDTPTQRLMKRLGRAAD